MTKGREKEGRQETNVILTHSLSLCCVHAFYEGGLSACDTLELVQGPKKWFAKCDKHYPSRSGQTSLATAVANFTIPRTSHFFDLCIGKREWQRFWLQESFSLSDLRGFAMSVQRRTSFQRRFAARRDSPLGSPPRNPADDVISNNQNSELKMT